ncbi:unnamed protein product [Commensalibacter communis]|nr:unnamed protein product [Commensalibacter communis]CAI3957921.1 unnamed protein product [Commensalibacter communis]
MMRSDRLIDSQFIFQIRLQEAIRSLTGITGIARG